MIWIFLLYVLPLAISMIGAYYFIKRDEGTTKEFLEVLPYLFIPLFNILAIVVSVGVIIEEWLKNDDDWQNFLNKKL
jgi:hypothetical protein